MFDIWIRNTRKKMFDWVDSKLTTDEKDNKVIRFMTQVMPKFISSVLIFLGMVWIFNQIYDKYGIERVVIVFGVALILLLRGILRVLSAASES